MWGNIGPLEISIKAASIVEENIWNEMLEKGKGNVCLVWCQSGVCNFLGLKSQNGTGGSQNLLDNSCFTSWICTFEGHLTMSLRLWHLSNLPQTFYTFVPVDITVIVSFQNHFYEKCLVILNSCTLYVEPCTLYVLSDSTSVTNTPPWSFHTSTSLADIVKSYEFCLYNHPNKEIVSSKLSLL